MARNVDWTEDMGLGSVLNKPASIGDQFSAIGAAADRLGSARQAEETQRLALARGEDPYADANPYINHGNTPLQEGEFPFEGGEDTQMMVETLTSERMAQAPGPDDATADVQDNMPDVSAEPEMPMGGEDMSMGSGEMGGGD